jgi:metal-responsive CopG/Arc/MetJ family transcriptional regulator
MIDGYTPLCYIGNKAVKHRAQAVPDGTGADMGTERICVSIPEGLLDEIDHLEQKEAWISAADMLRRLIERGIKVVAESAPASIRAEVIEAYGTQTRRINIPLGKEVLDDLDGVEARCALGSRSKAVTAALLAAIR